MNFPSTKRIAEWFPHLDDDEVVSVRGIMDGTANPEDYPAGERRVRECFHRPDDLDLQLTVIDSLIGGHGVETIRAANVYDNMGGRQLIAEYVNMGDSYYGTVLFDHDTGRWRLTTWGDFVESVERNRRKVGAS